MIKIKQIFLTSIVFFASACTEPGETTEIAAATGGVIGAGLGAIVGSQTGDPGAGLVIGAAAGAGTGALIGNSIQYQEETLRTQDEAIERQEKTIAAQRSELNELRKMNQDTPSFKSRLDNSLNNQDDRASYRPRIIPQAQSQTQLREKALQPEVPVLQPLKPESRQQKSYAASLYDDRAPVPQAAVPQAVVPQKLEEVKTAPDIIESVGLADDTKTVAAVNNDYSPATTECAQAEMEIGKAKLASDTSDKLFHTRRAIRLCSDKPAYHQSLGEVYLSLNRKEDALFEFQEALKYDSSYAPARESAAKLSGGAGYQNTNKY